MASRRSENGPDMEASESWLRSAATPGGRTRQHVQISPPESQPASWSGWLMLKLIRQDFVSAPGILASRGWVVLDVYWSRKITVAFSIFFLRE